MADALKAEGNKAFAAKDFPEAIEKFSQAIEIEPKNHVLYSNRSGAYAASKQFDLALKDAEETTEIKPDWAKGWGRKGAALHGTGDLVGSLTAYEEAQKLDPSNAQAKSGIEAVNRAIAAEEKAMGGGGGLGGLGDIFKDPNLYQKLARNPKTSKYLADPSFMRDLQGLQNSSGDIASRMQDPRFMEVLGVLLGIGLDDNPKDAGAETSKGEAEEDIPMPDRPSSSKPAQPTRAPEPEPEPEPEDEEAIAKKKAKEEADAEKVLGTEAYKKRDFDTAISHYDKAWSLNKDITYLTNKSAAEFEKGDYKSAIATCETAISEGREILAEYKIIAKAFSRIGSAYEKLQDLPSAIINYQKSLTEHRTPEILNKLRAAEKQLKTNETTAYISPEEAEKARELGGQKFKEADWPAAVAAYTEMTKRAPDDPRGYSNRAAALIKLMTFPSAVEDCDRAISKDPTFIRAYLRKAQALFAMKEYSRCADVCADASAQPTATPAEKREIEQQAQKALSAQYAGRAGETEEQTMERIQRDPEIMQILQDPVMQSILQQAKGDPAALQDHMKNADIARKVQKLVAAGVIRTR